MCIQTIGIMADVNEIRGCVYNYLPYYTYYTHTNLVQLSAVLYILYSYTHCTIICRTTQQLIQLLYNYLPYYTTTLTIIVQLSVVLYNNSYTHCTTVVQLLYNYLPPGMNGLPQNMSNASTTHIRQHCCLTISICSSFG